MVCGMLALPGPGGMTGRTSSSPGPAGTPTKWAWSWRGWSWRCLVPAGQPVTVAIDDALLRPAGEEGVYLELSCQPVL